MLKLNRVNKYYHNTLVLNDIDLTLEKNIILGLAGASGGGKSTLLRCIQKLEKIDSGEIAYDGKSGFMFQDFQLFPHMTVLENLIYAPTLQDKSNDHVAEAKKMLAGLCLSEKMHCYPHHLSGGQKQRAALARSLMMHPELLLCDEPTSGLDVATISEVVTLLESVRKRGVTMIIASHDLDFLTTIADRVVILKEGKMSINIEPKKLADPVSFLKDYY